MHDNGQLRAVHLILGYKPISSDFQAPKCVIKAKDPRLHRISIVVPGFLLPEGALVPRGTFSTQPVQESDLVIQSISEGIPRVVFPPQHTTGASASSQPTSKEESEGEEEKEKEKDIVDVLESDSEDLYKVFNQPPSPMTSTGVLIQSSPPQASRFKVSVLSSDEIGIQRRQESTLLDLLESRAGKDAPSKAP